MSCRSAYQFLSSKGWNCRQKHIELVLKPNLVNEPNHKLLELKALRQLKAFLVFFGGWDHHSFEILLVVNSNKIYRNPDQRSPVVFVNVLIALYTLSYLVTFFSTYAPLNKAFWKDFEWIRVHRRARITDSTTVQGNENHKATTEAYFAQFNAQIEASGPKQQRPPACEEQPPRREWNDGLVNSLE
uniref:Ion_trans domain-containing protein n=1 Tax=Steinernema glaseri TaxID=37863 RepID=A0A1I7Y6Z8_9BILA